MLAIKTENVHLIILKKLMLTFFLRHYNNTCWNAPA